MSKIIQRIYGDGPDGKIVLANSQIARLMTIGNDWERLRIGMRVRIKGPEASITGTPRLFIGACHINPATPQAGNLIGDATTDNFIGYRTAHSTWDYATDSYQYAITTGTLNLTKRVNTTITVNNIGSSDRRITDSVDKRSVIGFELARVSATNINGKQFGATSTGGGSGKDWTYDELVDLMEMDTVAATGLALSGPANSLAHDEATAGILNAVNISWDRTVWEMEISEVLVARHAA